MKRKRTWQEKLQDSKDLPKVVRITGRMSKRWGSGTVVVPAPREVDEIMAAVPKRKLTTVDQISRRLAEKHGASIGCPITTGIFAWIAAHAADEAEQAGKKRITPYWRTLKANGELNPKYPRGIPNLVARLKAEGHEVIQKGKRFLVADYEKRLAQ
jgi:hypothetical protein